MKAEMVRPRELPSFELDTNDYMWEQINDHHLDNIYDSVYYDGWKYAVYDVAGEEYLSRVRIDGIGRKGGVISERCKKSLYQVAEELKVSPHLIEDDSSWWGVS